MTRVRDVIKRDIGVKVEGVVKVFDRAALASEIREYVVTDKVEEELKRILDTFTRASETLRQGGVARDVMGVWISGFFGSGKSHFAKVLGHLLQNTELDAEGGESTIDAFAKHLSDLPSGRDVRLRLGELKLNTKTWAIFFEIKSRQPYGRPESVGEILLSEFYRFLGYSENLHIAALERSLHRRGLLETLEAEFERKFGIPWRSLEGRDDTSTIRSRLATVLPAVSPDDYPDQKAASQGLKDAFQLGWVTPEKIADELVDWVDTQGTDPGKASHLVFVIDEMGTFIGDSNDRISELNSIAEMIGNKGKGKVWLFVTSQQDLERVVDRTNFQPALVGRLNARFELKPHLISDEINKIVSERILKKKLSEEGLLRDIYKLHEGAIAQFSDLKASRYLGEVNESAFVDTYPLLTHQVRLAQDIFEALSGFRISGGVRSMISVAMDTLQEVAEEEVGVIVSFDQIFDAVENDLLSQEYLGASGVRSIYESGERVSGTPINPARVLKVLWLLQRITWIPRVPDAITKLLVRDFTTEIPDLRREVEETLVALQEAGYVARDAATGEWRFLNERERTIEQAIQEMVRPGGSRSITLAAIRRTSQAMCKEDLLTKKHLSNFTVTYGNTNVPFPFSVSIDGEAVASGAELDVEFITPLFPGRASNMEDLRRRNQAGGVKGRTVWWVADVPDSLEPRLKRYEALVKITADKRFVDDPSSDTQDALAERRKERDELRGALVRDLEVAFLNGTLHSGGQEVELEGGGDLKSPISKALRGAIPNVYPRFSVADKPFDFPKQVKALLNPGTAKLHEIAPGLDLFDTQGALQRDSALVAQVLEVVADLEDEGIDPVGAVLLDAKDAKGFKGLTRAPFGWPEELVRLVLAACFRGGVIYLERSSGAGPALVYEYQGSDDHFAKVSTFKKTVFRVAETSLSIDQIKEASKALIALGVRGTPESGNAIARAVRELGAALKKELDEANLRAQQGLPLPESITGAESALTEPIAAADPTVSVTAFLAEVDRWKALKSGLDMLRAFLDANRHQEFELSRRLEVLFKDHPQANAATLESARQDMHAILASKAVIARWPDYREAFELGFAAYRDAYLQSYEAVRSEVEATLASIKAGVAYREAPPAARDDVVAQVFGEGKPCDYSLLTLSSVQGLLDAASRRSLTALDQALMALPGYRAQVESELRALIQPPPPPDTPIHEWRSSELAGRRFIEESEVDDVLSSVGEELKARIRDGFLVVVK